MSRHTTSRLEVPATDRDRQRLIVALVQKKVSELLGHEKFNNSFQIGMLASFESFLETAKVKKASTRMTRPRTSTIPTRREDADERLGVDVGAVNGLARSYRLALRQGDAAPQDGRAGRATGRSGYPRAKRPWSSSDAWRRSRSCSAKLEERYDDWLIARLRSELPDRVDVLDRVIEEYHAERRARRQRRLESVTVSPVDPDEDGAAFAVQARRTTPDRGGLDTFFAYFFRGEGPEGVLSGAALATSLYTSQLGLFDLL